MISASYIYLYFYSERIRREDYKTAREASSRVGRKGSPREGIGIDPEIVKRKHDYIKRVSIHHKVVAETSCLPYHTFKAHSKPVRRGSGRKEHKTAAPLRH